MWNRLCHPEGAQVSRICPAWGLKEALAWCGPVAEAAPPVSDSRAGKASRRGTLYQLLEEEQAWPVVALYGGGRGFERRGAYPRQRHIMSKGLELNTLGCGFGLL